MFLAFLLALTTAVSGQSGFDISAGEPLPYDVKTENVFFDADTNYYYLLSLSTKNYIEFNTGHEAFIVVFDKALNPCGKISLKWDGSTKIKHLEPVKFYKTRDGFIVLCKKFLFAG